MLSRFQMIRIDGVLTGCLGLSRLIGHGSQGSRFSGIFCLVAERRCECNASNLE
jgi:hypothetical protein